MAILTISCSANGCAGDTQPTFGNSATYFQFGTWSGYGEKVWIPFVVNLPKDQIIVSATYKLISYDNSSGTTLKVKVGCEAADNPTQPTTWSGLDGRTMAAAYTQDDNVAAWTTGVEYTWNVTTTVQATLNRAGWVSGNKMGMMIHNNGSTGGNRKLATLNHATYTEPILEIVYIDFIPQIIVS